MPVAVNTELKHHLSNLLFRYSKPDVVKLYHITIEGRGAL